jgi:preprotein translocase subunit SecG
VPDWLGAWVLILYLPGIPLAFLQHALTSDLTRRGIERQLQRRITTRLPAAITPQLTGIGHFGRRLLIACVAVEFGMIALHILMGEGALAEHMRVFHGQTVGNEGTLAVLTGTLAWVTQFALILAILLLIVDRRVRRQRAHAAEAKERADAPPGRRR